MIWYTESDELWGQVIGERSPIDVYLNGKEQFQLPPEARLYQASQTVQTVIANHSTPLRDIYVVYEGRAQNSGLPIIKALLNPLVLWIWICACIILFGTLVALTPSFRAREAFSLHAGWAVKAIVRSQGPWITVHWSTRAWSE
jgi:cytochrome c biogenesis factor